MLALVYKGKKREKRDREKEATSTTKENESTRRGWEKWRTRRDSQTLQTNFEAHLRYFCSFSALYAWAFCLSPASYIYPFAYLDNCRENNASTLLIEWLRQYFFIHIFSYTLAPIVVGIYTIFIVLIFISLITRIRDDVWIFLVTKIYTIMICSTMLYSDWLKLFMSQM